MRSHGAKDGLKADEKTGAKPKKDAAASIDELTHKPSNMTCDKIDFSYDIREALVTGNIKIKQEKTNGTCEQVIFDEENNRAELKGNVVFVDDEKQEFKCNLMRVWFDTGNIKVQGSYQLTSPRKSAKEDPDKKGAPPPRHEFGEEPQLPAGAPAAADNKPDKPAAPPTKTTEPDKPSP
jgi:lipopolysaccharide export system protein LptA